MPELSFFQGAMMDGMTTSVGFHCNVLNFQLEFGKQSCPDTRALQAQGVHSRFASDTNACETNLAPRKCACKKSEKYIIF
eukprot:jgi/Botrbrau1/20919/Bobra.0135s0050.1